MRRFLQITLLVTGVGLAAGCHLPGLRDPVPASLESSRKLSGEGVRLLEQKRPVQAEELLAQAVKTCPTDGDARRYYADALWLRGAKAEAVAQLEEACKLSADAEMRVRLAEMHLEMGRLDEAGRDVEDALGRNFKLASAWRVRGRVMRGVGERTLAAGNARQAHECFLQALSDLHRAAGYAPGDRQVLDETAAVYRCLGQPDRALETMLCLVDTFSPGEEPQQALYWIGRDYMALDRPADAVASFSSAAARERPTPELLYRLAEAQFRTGRNREATATLQQALALDPRHAPSRQLLDEVMLAMESGPVIRR